jgi:glycosyltransferase involved in cell wall biosynthesis
VPTETRYAILMSGRAGRREDVTAGREPRREWFDLADALGARLIEARFAWPPLATTSGLLAAWTAFQKRNDYDVIVTDAERSGLVLALLLKISRTRRGHIMAGHWLSPLRKRVLLQWFGAGEAIDRLMVFGSSQERFALEQLRLPRWKVELVPTAADADFWHPLGLPQSGICSAGLERRDYQTLVEAVRGLDLRVTIAPASPWTTRGRFPGYELPTNVIRRHLDYLELRELYDRSEFVVIPLLDVDFQAGSLVMYEAMAMGKAVIASRTRGHATGDIVKDGETGILVPPGDPEALRDAIIRLHEDPAEARRMGANARRIVERGLNHDGYLRRMLQITRAVGAERSAMSSSLSSGVTLGMPNLSVVGLTAGPADQAADGAAIGTSTPRSASTR